MIFSVNGKQTKLKELVAYSKSNSNKSLKTSLHDFLNEKVIVYYKDNLEKTNQDFAYTVQEYKDGLLLFDLLQEKIWKQAEKDTIGLKTYFNNHREKYKFGKRVNVILATCTRLEKANLVKDLLEQGKTVDQIKALINEEPTIHVLFSSGILEATSSKLPTNFTLKKGVSTIYKEDDNHFTIVKVTKILEPTLKTLKEAKGLVINDFQEKLEKDWIQELRNRYAVKVNKRVLKKVIKQHQK